MSVAERKRLAAVRAELVGERRLEVGHHAAPQRGRAVLEVPGGDLAEAVAQQRAVDAGGVLEARLRPGCVSPSPMRVDASTNFVMPPGEKNSDGLTGRPKNMSSFE